MGWGSATGAGPRWRVAALAGTLTRSVASAMPTPPLHRTLGEAPPLAPGAHARRGATAGPRQPATGFVSFTTGVPGRETNPRFVKRMKRILLARPNPLRRLDLICFTLSPAFP